MLQAVAGGYCVAYIDCMAVSVQPTGHALHGWYTQHSVTNLPAGVGCLRHSKPEATAAAAAAHCKLVSTPKENNTEAHFVPMLASITLTLASTMA